MSTPQARTLARIESVAILRRQNYRNRDIARRLGVTTRTVERLNGRRRELNTQPAPPTATSRWEERAVCRSEDPNLFFLPTYTESIMARELEKARGVCGRCPVVRQCLRFAIDTGQPDGVWAGTTPQQRRELRATQTERTTG